MIKFGDLEIRVVDPEVNPRVYDEILSLRRVAYGAAGKIAAHLNNEDITEKQDFDGLLIVASIQNQVVGSIRVHQPLVAEDSYYCDNLKNSDYEFSLGLTVEATRLCVHPQFQGKKIGTILDVCSFIYSKFELGSDKIFGAFEEELNGLHIKMGYQPTDISKRSNFKYNEKEFLIHFVDLEEMFENPSQKQVSAELWNQYFIPLLLEYNQQDAVYFIPRKNTKATSVVRV